jgi:hypothetical protein
MKTINIGNGARVAGSVLLSLVATGWLVAFLVCWFGIGYNNAKTPAGYAGYVTQGAITGETKFIGIQYGPTSSGAGWLYSVNNVPLTVRTFEEDFSGNEGIISGDDTRIEFAVEVLLRVRPGKSEEGTPWVQVFFEKAVKGGNNSEERLKLAYDNNLKQKVRGFVRLSTEQHAGLDIQDNMAIIGKDVMAKVQEVTANSPFEVLQITVGRIHYPEQVTTQVENNLIAEQVREQKKINVTLTEKQADMDVIDAEGMAEAARIINESVTPRWLQFQALQALMDNIKSNTPTEIMIPVGPMGVPVTALPNKK